MKWSNKEIKILKKYYSTTPKYGLIKLFKKMNRNRTWLSIFKKANKSGFKKLTYKREINKILREKYSNTPMKILLKEVRKYVPGIKKTALIMRANRLGLRRREYVDELREKKIKTPQPSKELAWFLGVLGGDGHVDPLKNKSNSYDTSLTVTSREFMKQFAKIGKKLFGIHPSIREYNKYKLKGKWVKDRICSFLSKKMVKFLGDWKENMWFKTLNERFNWAWKDQLYISAFLSGFFDSDGSVIYNNERYQRKIVFAISTKKAQLIIITMLRKLGIECKVYWKVIQVADKANVKKFITSIESCIPEKRKKISLIKKELC